MLMYDRGQNVAQASIVILLIDIGLTLRKENTPQNIMDFSMVNPVENRADMCVRHIFVVQSSWG